MLLTISFASVGMFLLKLLLMVFVLSIIILIHELGHFMWAKRFGVHIYEFSIGMGPVIFSHKGKDKIDYNIRAIPIGGFVSMAGEVYADDDKIPKKKLLCNKPWHQRVIIMVAGVVNNFILAIVLLFVYALIWGGGAIKPIINEVIPDSAAYEAGLQSGDTILKINGYNVGSWDKAQIILYLKNKNEYYTFEVKHPDGKLETFNIVPKKETINDKGETRNVFGIKIKEADTSNIFKALGYSFEKFGAVVSSMGVTITSLITGKLSLSSLSGPVGIYQIVGESVNYNIANAIKYIIYIIAYLSINVGFINILPFPAFDGGHVLFLLIEKIKGSPVNSKLENTFHLIGFILIFLLMIIVTINDIIKIA